MRFLRVASANFAAMKIAWLVLTGKVPAHRALFFCRDSNLGENSWIVTWLRSMVELDREEKG